MRALTVDPLASENDVPVGDLGIFGGEKTRDGAQGRGLARAIGSYQCNYGARRHFERNALDGRCHSVIDDLQLADLKEVIGHRSPPHGLKWPIPKRPALKIGLDAPPQFREPLRLEQQEQNDKDADRSDLYPKQ